MSSSITGHCLCGNITYTIDAPIDGVAYCHCTDCRRSTGAASSLCALCPRSALKIKGEPKDYVVTSLTGKLSRRVFCPNCGSQLFHFADSNPSLAVIKTGSLSEEVQKTLLPNIEIFVKDRLPHIKERYGTQVEANAVPGQRGQGAPTATS